MAEIPNVPLDKLTRANVESTAQATAVSTITDSSSTEASASLQLPGTTIIPGLAKDLKIGETINFVLRGRSPDGQGLLYLLGQLVKANVPDNINIGDRVSAMIERQGQKLLFKILNIDPLHPRNDPSPNSNFALQEFAISVPEKLEKQIANLLFRIAPFLPNESLDTNAPVHDLRVNLDLLKNDPHKEFEEILKELNQIFVSDGRIGQSQNLIPFLKSANSKETIEKAKLLFDKIQLLLNEKTGSPEQRFFANIAKELKNIALLLTENSGKITLKGSDDIEKLLKVLTNEIDQEALGKTSKKNANYFDTLKLIRGGLSDLTTDGSLTSKNIESLLEKLHMLQPETKDFVNLKLMSPVQLKELISLSASMEQFIKTAEVLKQIEPLMQMMQAPELILFPFLFQGLLSFGEIVIDPNAHRNKNNAPSEEESEEEEKAKAANSSYRYTSSIELPNLGLISFSSLQENNEIDIRINTEDEEKTEFIRSRLKELKNELASAGIISREILLETVDLSDSIVIE